MIHSFPSNYSNPPDISQMTLSASGAMLGEVDSTGKAQVFAVVGGATQWTSTSNSSGTLLLSPDGSGVTLTGGPGGFGAQETTELYVNGTFIASLSGATAGWIDNGHVLVNYFNIDKEPIYTNSEVYGPNGIVTGPGPTAYLPAFQVVMPAGNPVDLVYTPVSSPQNVIMSPQLGNVIVSLSTSKITWASGSPSGVAGAVASAETVFVSGSQLLAEPY